MNAAKFPSSFPGGRPEFPVSCTDTSYVETGNLRPEARYWSRLRKFPGVRASRGMETSTFPMSFQPSFQVRA